MRSRVLPFQKNVEGLRFSLRRVVGHEEDNCCEGNPDFDMRKAEALWLVDRQNFLVDFVI